MFPQGSAWQYLRQQALAVVPDGARILHSEPPTIATWLRKGAFTVTSHTANRFLLSASQTEVACALYSEAALLLDSAAEHSVTIRDNLSAGRWYSAAWLCVTFYYWAFFLALSLTRMTGNTAIFLSSNDVSNLHTLSGSIGPSPGAGPFILECKAAQTVGYLDVSLKKASRSRLHDLIWRMTFDQIRTLSEISTTGSRNNEERLLLALRTSSNVLGITWPSDLRNLINYGPGQGYFAVRKQAGLKAFGDLSIDPASNFDEALDRLENNVTSLSRRLGVLGNPTAATKVLMDVTFALDAMTSTLHSEVIERRHIDQRWINARADFFRQRFNQFNSHEWPYLAT